MRNSLDLNIYKELKDRNLKKEGFIIAEGRYVIDRMIESGITIHSVLCIDELAEYYQQQSQGLFPVHILNKHEISQIAGFPFHRGAIAAGLRPELLSPEIPELIPGTAQILVICPATDNPDNLGSICRIARAFGIKDLLLGKLTSDPYSRKVIRVSMGNIFHIRLRLMTDEHKTICLLKQKSYRLVGASLDPKAVSLKEYRHNGPKAFIFGSEYHGLSKEWSERCDDLIRIPMKDGTDSLNVSVAAGIILHQLT